MEIVLQGFIAEADKIGVEIQRSEELTTKWDQLKEKLDKFIKSLEGYNYKKILILAGCIATISYFAIQMGLYRKVPSLLANIGSNIPLPDFKSKEIPKEEVSMLSKLVDTPITASPLTIVTTIGTVATIYGILKVSQWIIKKLRK